MRDKETNFMRKCLIRFLIGSCEIDYIRNFRWDKFAACMADMRSAYIFSWKILRESLNFEGQYFSAKSRTVPHSRVHQLP